MCYRTLSVLTKKVSGIFLFVLISLTGVKYKNTYCIINKKHHSNHINRSQETMASEGSFMCRISPGSVALHSANEWRVFRGGAFLYCRPPNALDRNFIIFDYWLPVGELKFPCLHTVPDLYLLGINYFRKLKGKRSFPFQAFK